MKKISVFILAACSMLAFGQKVSDYKYIYIPERFKDFKDDTYDLDKSLVKALSGKKYIILQEDKNQWPAEARDNSCAVAVANLINDSNFLRNKILLEFKDCNDKVVSTSKGASSIKEFKEGFQDALKQAVNSVPVSYPTNDTPATLSAVQVNNVQKDNTEDKPSSVEASSAPSAKNYTNGKINLQKIEIGTGQFILADSNSSVPFATFKATSKQDVFLVKLSDGSSTIGYFENKNIIIDIPQSNGGYSKEIFSAK